MIKTILPIQVKYLPIEKLALINFEKKPDSVYKALELQYLNGKEVGTGYRVLAYRNDGYVDMYDAPSLKFDANEQCNVAEKGLYKHVQRQIKNPIFQVVAGMVEIAFDFEDLEQRKIHVYIKEQNRKKSIPMNLLAPIGSGSEKPSSLPVFFLYDFDFIRRKNTIVDIKIDEKNIKLDPFPVPFPMNGQMRYYTRYTMKSQIMDFLPITNEFKEVELDEQLQYFQQDIKYQFVESSQGIGLSQIELMKDRKVVINFNPAFHIHDQVGEFSICPPEEMGSIAGIYKVTEKDNYAEISIIPNKGWTSVPNSIISKLILSPKSIFCSWCKQYKYSAVIDLKAMKVRANWANGSKK